MAVLNSWQKLTRVLPGKPFGDGRDGVGTISGNTTESLAKAGCSGAASGTSLTLDTASTFANGDVVVIYQTRGTGATQFEINKIQSGGGTTSLTMAQALHYTYTDSGNSQAQIVKFPMYSSLTINSGIDFGVTAWDENKGGIFPLAALTASLVGNWKANGGIGQIGGNGAAGGSGGGFLGGSASHANPSNANQGEGTTGARAASTSANGNGGGGGATSGASTGVGGGGGANGANGNAGTGTTGGSAGATAGAADLTTAAFGGGGGGGANDGSEGGNAVAGGGSGGGFILGFIRSLTVSGSINADGGAGGNGDLPANESGDGGGGAGGSILLCVQTATLGSNLVHALGGSGNDKGGAGGNGRIAIHHSATVTGTTNPTFTDVSDPTLVETGAVLLFD